MFILLISLLSTLHIFACDFSSNAKEVISFSGVITQSFQDLGLLKNSKLKGVSVFHPVSKEEFKGTFYPGGLFLSHDTLKKFSGSVLFYDESRELTRILRRHPEIKAVEVKTRSLGPVGAIERVEEVTKSYLSGCDFKALKTSLEAKLVELKKHIPKNKTMLFFLGHLNKGRPPELLMVNDGIVKWMLQEKLIKTYDSELAYVYWSAKILNGMPKETLKVGIKDPGNELVKKVEKVSDWINLTWPGALIPGRGQVEAMLFLFKNL